MSRVTRGFDTHTALSEVRKHQRTAVTGNAWIRQPTQSPRESETAVAGDAWIRQPTQPCRESENINELLSRVTRGFNSPHSPLGSQNFRDG